MHTHKTYTWAHTSLSQTWLLNTIPGIHTDHNFCLPGHHTKPTTKTTHTPSAHHYGHTGSLACCGSYSPTNVCPLWPQPSHQAALPSPPRTEKLRSSHTRVLQALNLLPASEHASAHLIIHPAGSHHGWFPTFLHPDFHDPVSSGIPVLNQRSLPLPTLPPQILLQLQSTLLKEDVESQKTHPLQIYEFIPVNNSYRALGWPDSLPVTSCGFFSRNPTEVGLDLLPQVLSPSNPHGLTRWHFSSFS